MSENTILPSPGQDRSLVDAFDEFRRILCPDGKIHGQENGFDCSAQFRILEAEARRLGFVYDGLEPLVEGGREHDLIYDAITGTVLKFTKASSAAYVVQIENDKPRLRSGDLLGYLDRLILHNKVFGDFTTFVGIGGIDGSQRLITRQERVKGREARWEEIIRFMAEELGFKKLRHNHGIGYEDSYAFIRDNVAVFDMRPANVFMAEAGVVIAVDSIPVRLNDSMRDVFVD